MTKTYIVDPVSTNSVSFAYQLSQIKIAPVTQVGTLKEALKKLAEQEPFEGTVFTTNHTDRVALYEFIDTIRQTHPKLAVVAIAETLSPEDLRTFLIAGVDQFLVRPFNNQQLKDAVANAARARDLFSEEHTQTVGSQFSTDMEKLTDQIYKISMEGNLTETGQLPEIPPTAKSPILYIDCDRLRGINSLGIRSWMLWMKSLEESGVRRIEFLNMHYYLLQQASHIAGFIPSIGNINSFYLLYWSEVLDDDKEFKIRMGKDYSSKHMKIPKNQVGFSEGNQIVYELDITSEKILKFFQGEIEYI